MNWPDERTIGLNATLDNCIELLQMVSPAINAAQLFQRMPAVFTGFENVIYVPASSTNTAAFIVYDMATRQVMVVSTGITGTDQMNAMIRGFTGTADAMPNDPQPWVNAAANIQAQIPTVVFNGITKITMIGHSFGGATVEWISANYARSYPSAKSSCYTFGAPQAAYAGQETMWTNVVMRRCFSDADPIPWLPTPLTDGSTVLQFVSNTQARTWSRYRHPGMGCLLRPNEDVTYAINPTRQPPLQFIGSLISWLTGTTMFGDPMHSLAAYAQVVASMRLIQALPPDTTTPPVRVRGTPPTASELNTSRELSIAVGNGVIEADPTAAGQVAISAVQYIPHTKWKGKRIKGHRYIFYGDQQIMPVRTRRLQISLVRYLNKHQVGV